MKSNPFPENKLKYKKLSNELQIKVKALKNFRLIKLLLERTIDVNCGEFGLVCW
jgi:hypothetical protein